MRVRGRYAPSPTGPLHLGNVRSALLAWLDIRSAGGAFVLRMEDLDPQRSSAESARGIIDDLRWLGLDWDEGPDVGGTFGPYDQSARGELYRSAIDALTRDGAAYACTCSRAEVARTANAPHAGEDGPRYPGTCRAGPSHPERLKGASSIRLRVENGPVTFVDGLAGPQSFDVSAAVGDFVIRRVDGVAAYQLAVALDDARMGMTRVVRGDDLLPSTARQRLVYRALGLHEPSFAHLPLLVDETGHRLAKRGGALSVASLRASGVRPEAVVGFLASTAGLTDGRPIAARELIAGFALDRVARTPAIVTERDIAALVG